MTFCVGRLAATSRKHRVEIVMCNNAREDGIGMHDDMNDIEGERDSGVGSKGRGDGRAGGSNWSRGVLVRRT